MKIYKLLLPLLLLILFVGASVSHARETSACVYYFYGMGCPACANTSPFLDELEKEYPDLEIKRFEIYSDTDNAELFREFAEAYRIPKPWGVPTVLIGDKYLVGDMPVINGLEGEITNNPTASCPGENGSDGAPAEELGTLTLATIVGAAVVDSINPCAIAVLLILLSALLVSGDRKRAVKAGLAFTLSIYIAYFLFGLGLFSAIQVSGLSNLVYRFVGILAILIGLANIKDYFWYGGGGFVMEIPRRWRPKLKTMLSAVTSPVGAFLMGFVIILFELPCTGGPYLFVLGLLAQKMSLLSATPLLLLYNLFFILPLIVITLIIYQGFTSVEKATEWKDRNIRRLHLVTGIVMLVLGIVVALRLV